ncbi:MAG: hypothetical protein J7L38_06805 [Thermoproteales archaeon]|nr:hypothetical protein [Thermoproteales archaeon]
MHYKNDARKNPALAGRESKDFPVEVKCIGFLEAIRLRYTSAFGTAVTHPTPIVSSSAI